AACKAEGATKYCADKSNPKKASLSITNCFPPVIHSLEFVSSKKLSRSDRRQWTLCACDKRYLLIVRKEIHRDKFTAAKKRLLNMPLDQLLAPKLITWQHSRH